MPLLVFIPFFNLLIFFIILFVFWFLSSNKFKRELLLDRIIFILTNEY